MCKQRVALDMIEKQPRRGGLSKAALLLHEKQCEDFEKMENRMTIIEEKVDALGHRFDQMNEKLDRVLIVVCERRKKWQIVKSVCASRAFWSFIAALVCATFGITVGV